MSIVVLYKGRRGSGKTLTMTKDGYIYKKNGFRVLSNYKTTFSELIEEDEILNLDKNSGLHDCVIMMDEIQIFFDSRRSMRKQNVDFSNFIQQIRKRNITLLGATQYSNTIDLRLRQHTDIIANPNFIKEFNVCEVIYIDMTSMEETINQIQEPRTIRIVYDPKPIFKMFNTAEMLK